MHKTKRNKLPRIRNDTVENYRDRLDNFLSLFECICETTMTSEEALDKRGIKPKKNYPIHIQRPK